MAVLGAWVADARIYGRLVRIARPYWPHLGGVFILSILEAPVALLVPIPVKLVVDHVVGNVPAPAIVSAVFPSVASSALNMLLFAAALMVAISLVNHLVNMGRGMLKHYTGERLVLEFRRDLFRHAQDLSLTYHDNRGTADAIYKIQSDETAIEKVALNALPPLASSLVTVTAMVYVTARIDARLAWIALLVVPVTLILTHVYRTRMRRQWRTVKEQETSALGVIQEVLTSLRVVKAFGREGQEEARFVHIAEEGLGSRVRVVLSQYSFGILLGLASVGGTALVLYVGGRGVLDDRLTLGSLLLVMSYLNQIYGPLESIGKNLTSLQNSLASAERALQMLDVPPGVPNPANGVSIGRAKGDVVFDRVAFAYREGETVLRNVSFGIEAGSSVGIAGRTGAGKTTLINLLTRLYDPTEGRILLDGVDLRAYDLEDLRRQYSIVTQEPVLFSTTIAENIRYGDPDASIQAIEDAAIAANAFAFVSSLPEGFNTLVGERGMSLSGGERQRIALARAFLRNAPVLILDEPTSSVDMKTEGDIMDAIERLQARSTTFMIAHRLSTLASCDNLLYLDQGSLKILHGPIAGVIDEAIRRGSLEAALGVAT